MAAHDIMVGGLHAVRIALTRAPTDCLELSLKTGSERAEHDNLVKLAGDLGVSVQQVESRTLDRLYDDGHHQGAVLRRRPPALAQLDDFLDREDLQTSPPLFLVLDQVQDPRNFGACLRVADGAGVTAVIYPRDNSARMGTVLAKAASGAIDTVALAAVTNLATAVRTLRDAGVWITGAAHDTDLCLFDVDFRGPSALVLGNEGDGLRHLTRTLCDQIAKIPMSGELANLNVASACAVSLFEAGRQRRG